MKECTNPQYVIRATDENFHTEIFSVEPGAYPAIVNEIPPGQPTIAPMDNVAAMSQAVAKLLAEHGHCTIPESLDAPAVEQDIEESTSTGLEAIANNPELTQAVEEIPGIPSVYNRRAESTEVSGGGEGALIFGAVALVGTLAGGRFLVNQVQNRMFTDLEIQNHESTQPEDHYSPAQHTASVSSVPVHEPSPWQRSAAYAGNAPPERLFTQNQGVKTEVKWGEIPGENRGEMKSISLSDGGEMSSSDPEQLSRVRARLSGLMQKPETVATQPFSPRPQGEITGEMDSISPLFTPEGDLTKAKELYFLLRGRGIDSATDLGDTIFGIRGGKRWGEISSVLRDWGIEWENNNNNG